MRVNIYSQELTQELELVQRIADTGVTYSAVRMFLHSTALLHHPPADDDRSGVTFWLPKSRLRRQQMADWFRNAALLIEGAPSETGLD